MEVGLLVTCANLVCVSLIGILLSDGVKVDLPNSQKRCTLGSAFYYKMETS